MGAWSTAILGNDSSAEVYEYFKRMYRYQEGPAFKWSVPEIIDSLYTYYYDSITTMPSEKCHFFLALSLGLWEMGEDDPAVFNQAKTLVENRVDYDAWKELDANEKTLKQRLAATTAFLQKISERNPAPKKRELKPANVSALAMGDCLAVPHGGRYVGLVVVNDGRNVDDGSNHLAFTTLYRESLPTMDDFLDAPLALNEAFVNRLLKLDSDAAANPPVVFIFRFSKAAIEKAKKEAVYVGNFWPVHTHYDWRSVRVADVDYKAPSVKKLVAEAVNHWSEQPWPASPYRLRSDWKNPAYVADADFLHVAGWQIPLQNIRVSISNSLWHINVSVQVVGIPIEALETHWLVFCHYIEHRTGREVNLFKLLDEEEAAMACLMPATELDFDHYKLKHVEDTATI